MGTKATPKDPNLSEVVFGEGAFYFNYGETDEEVVGAVNGGAFNREVEYREPEYLGRRGATKGLKRKLTTTAVMTINALEIANAEKLSKFYAGLEVSTSNAEYDSVTAKEQIGDSDYLKNVAFVGETYDGKDVVVIVKNALGDGNLSLAIENGNDIVPEVQFTGHYEKDNKIESWEIRYIKVV